MKSSKKILGASAALGLAVALAAGSTFAWFSLGKTDVTVSGVDLTVGSIEEGSLSVALAKTYSGTVDASATAASATLDDTLKSTLYPATMTSTLSAGGALSGDVGFNVQGTTEGGWMDFYVLFAYSSKEAGQAVNIVLDAASVVEPKSAATKTIDLSDYADYCVATSASDVVMNGETGDDEAPLSFADLLDLGFYGETSADITAVTAPQAANAVRVMFAKATSATANENYKVWSPNEALATGGEVVATDSPFTAEQGNGKGYWKNNFAGCLYDFNRTYDADLGTFLYEGRTVQKAYDSTVTAGETQLLTLTANAAGTGYEGALHVWLWVEGTDGDCWGSVMNDQINISLKFKIAE